MQAFIANLKHAIRNRESVTIGGGKFSADELKPVAAALETVQTQPPGVADALLKLYNLAIQQLDQSATHDGLTNCDALAAARSALEAAGYSHEQLKEPKRTRT